MKAHRGLGLAAPQVGIDARLFITHWGGVFVNPILNAHSKHCVLTQEGCLSFPGRLSVVQRYEWVKVNGRRYAGENGIVIQHEIDHLNGITIGA
jgi:peptide deformylase